jgi:hypothetical protein
MEHQTLVPNSRDDMSMQRSLVARPEGTTPHGRLSHRLEEYIKMNITDMRWEGEDCIHPAQDRGKWLVACSLKCGPFLDYPKNCWLPRKPLFHEVIYEVRWLSWYND